VHSDVDDGQRFVHRTSSHVLFFPPPRRRRLEEQDAGGAVGQEDGHRVGVGLGEELAWLRSDDVGS
jgi:hypothetical protein